MGRSVRLKSTQLRPTARFLASSGIPESLDDSSLRPKRSNGSQASRLKKMKSMPAMRTQASSKVSTTAMVRAPLARRAAHAAQRFAGMFAPSLSFTVLGPQVRPPTPQSPGVESGNRPFVERVKFVICSSFLLSPQPAVPAHDLPAAGSSQDVKGKGKAKREAPAYLLSTAGLVLALALAWPKTLERFGFSGAIIIVTFAMIQHARRRHPEDVFVAEVERLVAAAQSFDITASKASALVRDVECVSRGLGMCVGAASAS